MDSRFEFSPWGRATNATKAKIEFNILSVSLLSVARAHCDSMRQYATKSTPHILSHNCRITICDTINIEEE